MGNPNKPYLTRYLAAAAQETEVKSVVAANQPLMSLLFSTVKCKIERLKLTQNTRTLIFEIQGINKSIR